MCSAGVEHPPLDVEQMCGSRFYAGFFDYRCGAGCAEAKVEQGVTN